MVLEAKSDLATVTLFAGAGDLAFGLEAVGFSIVFATDIDEHSCRSLEWGNSEAEMQGKQLLEHAHVFRDDIEKANAGLVQSKNGHGRDQVDH